MSMATVFIMCSVCFVRLLFIFYVYRIEPETSERSAEIERNKMK